MSTASVPKNEIRIISHSTLFYWWPVWAIGFLMALITAFGGQRMTTVPAGATIREGVDLKIGDTHESRTVLVIPKDGKIALDKNGKPIDPHLRMSGSKNPGVLFCIVILVVVTITNVPLRGLWSVIVITFIVSITIILAILGKWDDILEGFSLLDIRINLGGYLLLSTVLFVIWLVVFLLFDKQIYIVFTPGQFRVRLEIGDAETAYDTTGMTIQKQRSDLFRHWILGLGSGDLIVKTAGAQAHHFDLPNVLFLGRKVKEIEEMLRSRQVVAG
ncbi:MAG: hypothetical protein L0215_03195 [Gemmataceae bacterium]|nr:hypothetical protein [Gemmataceae bacterium]